MMTPSARDKRGTARTKHDCEDTAGRAIWTESRGAWFSADGHGGLHKPRPAQR